jgi:DNA mismatch repair ATPase MutL
LTPTIFTHLQKDETATAVHTQKGASKVDCIRALHGHEVAKNLIHITHKDEKLKIDIDCYVTNPNYNKKKSEFLLFINSASNPVLLIAHLLFRPVG